MVRYPYIFNVRILQFWRYPLSVLPSSNNFTPSEPYLFTTIIIKGPIPSLILFASAKKDSMGWTEKCVILQGYQIPYLMK